MKFHIEEKLRYDEHNLIEEIKKQYPNIPIEIRSNGWVNVESDEDKSENVRNKFRTI